MYKVAVIGDRDTIIAFKVLGIDVYSVEKNEDEEIMAQKIKSSIDYLASNNYAIIFLTEEYAKLVEESLKRYKNELLPMITLIPSNKGSLNIALNKIDENIEKAIGTNIF